VAGVNLIVQKHREVIRSGAFHLCP
jgi:hypothetical protein